MDLKPHPDPDSHPDHSKPTAKPAEAKSSKTRESEIFHPSKSEGDLTTEDALNKILRLVNHREHSTASLRKRLRQVPFEDRVIEQALARAQELGLVDDIRFGNILVRSRLSQRKGCQGIERELIQEGIDPETIEAYCEYRDEVAPHEEVSQAVALLKKHPPKAKNQRESAYRKLRQKGYDNSTTHEAIRLWMESQPH